MKTPTKRQNEQNKLFRWNKGMGIIDGCTLPSYRIAFYKKSSFSAKFTSHSL